MCGEVSERTTSIVYRALYDQTVTNENGIEDPARGFSVSMDNFAASFNHNRPSESHDWGFETMLMRLLYFSKAINVCNV